MSELSNIKPIDLFWTFHQVKNNFNLNNLISTKKNHYGEYTIKDAKDYLHSKSISVRR